MTSPYSVASVRASLAALRDPEKAAFLPRFFKTGKGEYGEGDVFLGITVPKLRAVAKAYRDLPLADIERLLKDRYHEHRFAALEILVMRFEKGDDVEREKIVRFYLKHLDRVNNWDLVDTSAPYILGEYLLEKGDDARLDMLARSTHLWTQRVAMVATYAFIKNGNLKPTFRIAKMLLAHKHDLIHKAVGWMLREAGKKDEVALRTFLDTHAAVMPRTALRYAIEKFDPRVRARYLAITPMLSNRRK